VFLYGREGEQGGGIVLDVRDTKKKLIPPVTPPVTPPVAPDFSYAPDTSLITYHDLVSPGSHIHKTLAYFNSNANMANVSFIKFEAFNIINSVLGLLSLPKLAWFECFSQLLPVSSVNGILTDLDSNGLSGGTITIDGQTPPAPPSGAGVVALANLNAKGWTVATD
jgi:hypothetical protein